MRYLDRHPNQFRLVFGLLATYLFVLAAVTFLRTASRPTDENLFTDPVSNLYITQKFLAISVVSKQASIEAALHLGDLIERVGTSRVVTSEEMRDALARQPGDTVEIGIVRFVMGQRISYRVTKSSLLGNNVRELGPTARVIDVTARGASDRAGMKVGDLILRINGQSFKNSVDADRILAEGQVGKALLYDVLRENQVLSLHVTIAAIGLPFPLLVSTFCGLVFFGLGVFLGFVRPRLIAARLSALAFLAAGYFMLVFLSRRGYAGATFDRVRDLTMVISAFTIFPLSLHSGHYFPMERPELIAKKWVRILGYVLAIVGLIAALLLGQGVFFLSIGILLLYSALVVLIFRKRASEEYKRLNRLAKYVSLITAVGTIFLGIYLGYMNQLQSLGYLGFLLILIPLSHLYTIGRHRLLGLDLRIRRNIQYILVTTTWVVALGFLAFSVLLWLQGAQLPIPNVHLTATSIEVLDTPLQFQQRVWLEKGILMLMSVLVVYVSWKIAQRGQRLIDKIFFRSQYDYRRAANELVEMMATKLSMVELAQGTVAKLAGLLQLKRVGVLFIRDEDACCCQEAYGFDGSAWAEFCLSHGSTVVAALQKLGTESSVDALPEPLRTEFRKYGFLYIACIRSKEKLIGALLVGEKRSEATFRQDDIDFLGVVAKQASVAIENAFLYEELAGKERMKHELAIARRIQLASLPQGTPTIEGLEIAGASHPAMEVGGDYFDYLNGEAGKITIIVGDVSGKGTSAALYMSKVQGILRSLHAFRLSPKELFIRTNRLLCHDLEKSSFVTAINGSFDARGKKLILARAGHLPLYHYIAKTRTVEIITPKGLGLGLEATDIFSSELEERVVLYLPDDVFVFASDGVTEAESESGRQFGEENLVRLLSEHSSEHASAILDQIMRAVRDFAGEREQTDDQTLVVVKAR
jgi:serine phosphatase RsbU (regulator of sigma subunit)